MGLLDLIFGKKISKKQDLKLLNNWFSENLKHIENNDYDKSIHILSKMILLAKKMQPKLKESKPVNYTYNENIHFNITELYYMRASVKSIISINPLDDFNTALSLNPKHIESLYNRAMFYYNTNKDIKNALADISECLKLEPNDKDFIEFQKILIKSEKEFSEMKEAVVKLSEDSKQDSKEMTDLLKKFHSLLIKRDVNNIQEKIDLLDKIIPLIEKVQLPIFETIKKNSEPDPELGYSASLITFTDKEITFKYHYCELLYHRGTFKSIKGDVSAINDFEQSIEIFKEESTLINLSLAYANLSQDIVKSINCIKECLNLFPHSTRAKETQLKIFEAANKSLKN